MLSRLQQLDVLLTEAYTFASKSKALSTLNISDTVYAKQHRDKIDKFNATKYWFMKFREYKV